MNKWKSVQCSLVFTVILLGCQRPPPLALSNLEIIAWPNGADQIPFIEPSGLVYHHARQSLFVVGDEGDLGEVALDGTILRQKRIQSADFEGITYNPSTGLLYIAIEGRETILEIDPDNFNVMREFELDRTFGGELILESKGNGLEAITFVPDKTHTEGGLFYLTNQGFGPPDSEPSLLFELTLPLTDNSSSPSKIIISRLLPATLIDMSGLYYDEQQDLLIILSDDTNKVATVTREGEVLQQYELPSDDQEGIAVDDQGFIYLAIDTGAILKLEGTP